MTWEDKNCEISMLSAICQPATPEVASLSLVNARRLVFERAVEQGAANRLRGPADADRAAGEPVQFRPGLKMNNE